MASRHNVRCATYLSALGSGCALLLMAALPVYRYAPFDAAHLDGVIALCEREGWPSYPADPPRAHRVMTAAGVTTVVAVAGDGRVVGFACLQSDGEIQAHLSVIAVAADHRRHGVARRLLREGLAIAGGERLDLVTDSAEEFYMALPHRRFAGFRVYPQLQDTSGAGGAGDGPAVRPVLEDDQHWVADLLVQRWGGTVVVSRERRHEAARLPGIIAQIGADRVGLATYRRDGGDVELVTLDSVIHGRGVGTALLSAVADETHLLGSGRLWLVTTNDNLDAIRFYQRRRLRVVAVHAGAVDDARRLKPSIPTVGAFGIPVHDEIELELRLHD
jgi:ribosomal protein S18 acetylase RimI-like enzyme